MSKKKKYQIDTKVPIEKLEGTQRIILDLALGTRRPQNEKITIINIKIEIKAYDLV